MSFVTVLGDTSLTIISPTLFIEAMTELVVDVAILDGAVVVDLGNGLGTLVLTVVFILVLFVICFIVDDTILSFTVFVDDVSVDGFTVVGVVVLRSGAHNFLNGWNGNDDIYEIKYINCT